MNQKFANLNYVIKHLKPIYYNYLFKELTYSNTGNCSITNKRDNRYFYLIVISYL